MGQGFFINNKIYLTQCFNFFCGFFMKGKKVLARQLLKVGATSKFSF